MVLLIYLSLPLRMQLGLAQTGTSQAPTISPIADVTTPANTPSPILPFTVTALGTDINNLKMSAAILSIPANLVNSVIFSGVNAARTVQVIPQANQAGVAQITIVAEDEVGRRGTTTFSFDVLPCDSCPKISVIADQVAALGSVVGPIRFTIGGGAVPSDELDLFARSSNIELVSQENVLFGGTGTTRQFFIMPVPNQFGTATISIVVSDGSAMTATHLKLTVVPTIHLEAQAIVLGGTGYLELRGLAGQGSILQSSTDLQQWLPIYTNTIAGGQVAPLIFKEADYPQRFFRAVFAP